MGTDWIRRFCLSLPHVTEHMPWGADLVFKIGGKMFAMVVLEPPDRGMSHSSSPCMSMKCSPEVFAELVDRVGIIPAPYLARANWVALESADALSRPELERLLRDAYEMVLAKLPKKAQVTLRKPTKLRKPMKSPKPSTSRKLPKKKSSGSAKP
jgi:predicted DNA-binding protein (MmcQ/YjbR family)